MRFNQTKSLIIGIWFPMLLNACSGGGSKKQKEAVAPEEGKKTEQVEDQPDISGDKKLLVQSMSNNPFTSRTVSRSKAQEIATEYSQTKSKNPMVHYGIVVANRLSGKSATDSFDDAQKILDHYIAKNPDADIPEPIQLELALSALQTNKLGLAEFYLQRLTKSKNARIRVAAINALGVVAIRVDRIPEAVATFREALSVDSNYEPARLNIGFLALQGGDAATAKQMLGSMQDDWFVDSGFVGIDRLSGDAAKADQRCDRILSKHPKHKPTLINCAINAYQGQADYKKAREYLGRALQVTGGPSAWNDKSGRLLGLIDVEESRASQAKSAKAAEVRKEKADHDKAAVDAAAPKADKAPAGP